MLQVLPQVDQLLESLLQPEQALLQVVHLHLLVALLLLQVAGQANANLVNFSYFCSIYSISLVHISFVNVFL